MPGVSDNCSDLAGLGRGHLLLATDASPTGPPAALRRPGRSRAAGDSAAAAAAAAVAPVALRRPFADSNHQQRHSPTGSAVSASGSVSHSLSAASPSFVPGQPWRSVSANALAAATTTAVPATVPATYNSGGGGDACHDLAPQTSSSPPPPSSYSSSSHWCSVGAGDEKVPVAGQTQTLAAAPADGTATAVESPPATHYIVPQLCTDLPDPANAYEKMVFENIADILCTLSSDPSSYHRLAPVLADDLTSWLPRLSIDTRCIVNWLFNQVACIPSFAYTCARLCALLCSRLTHVTPTFTDALFSRCSVVYSGWSSLLQLDSLDGYGQLLMLFTELYVHVLLGGQQQQQQRPLVLAEAVTELVRSLLQSAHSGRAKLQLATQSLTLAAPYLYVDNRDALETVMSQLQLLAESNSNNNSIGNSEPPLELPIARRLAALISHHRNRWTDQLATTPASSSATTAVSSALLAAHSDVTADVASHMQSLGLTSSDDDTELDDQWTSYANSFCDQQQLQQLEYDVDQQLQQLQLLQEQDAIDSAYDQFLASITSNQQ